MAWPGQHCDARRNFGSPEPHELQQRRHWAAPVGFGADFGHWDVIVGVTVGDSTGCSSSLGDGVGGAGAAPCTLPEVAGGRSATLAMQEERDFQVKDDTKVMGSHNPCPCHRSAHRRGVQPPSLPAGEQPAGRVRAQAGLRFLRRGAESPETFLLIKV